MKEIIFLALVFAVSCYKVKGIDLSAWDETVYWDKLKKEVDFVILRAGTGYNKYDKVFEKYYNKCKEHNIPVGAYWYSYATTVKGSLVEANSFSKALAGKKFEYPVYYDIEEKNIFNTGKQNVSNMLKKFCSHLESKKYYCGIYSSKSHLENYFTNEVLNKYDIWLAHYATSTSYKGHKIWQYCENGKLSGKPGDCDLNWSYYDYPSLIKSKHLNGY